MELSPEPGLGSGMAEQVLCVDLDFTVIQYKQPEFTEMQYRVIAEGMVSLGYSPDLVLTQWMQKALEFAQNGLVADLKTGNVVSLGRGQTVRACYHGFQRKTDSEIRDLYGNPPVFPISLEQPYLPGHYWLFHTHFSLPESALYHLCIHFLPSTPSKSLSSLETDLYHLCCARYTPSSPYTFIPSLYSDLHLYVESMIEVRELMRRRREVMVLCTNSGWEHVERLCEWGLGREWRESFAEIVVDAGKPGYFEGGKEGVRSGGSYRDLVEKYPGKTFTYIGDSYLSDIAPPKVQLHWSTIAILPELSSDSSSPYLPHYGPFLHPDNYWYDLIRSHSNAQYSSFRSFLSS